MIDGKQIAAASVANTALAAGAGKREVYRFPAAKLIPCDNADWPVTNPAGGGTDSNDTGVGLVRLFDDTTSEAVGTEPIEVPSWATKVAIRVKSRAETAPGSAKVVALSFYSRVVADESAAAAVAAWSSAVDSDAGGWDSGADVAIGANEFWVIDEWVGDLSVLSLVAGDWVQLCLARDIADGSDDLVGDFAMSSLNVEFR